MEARILCAMMQHQAIRQPALGARFAGWLTAPFASAARNIRHIAHCTIEIAEKRRQRRALSRLDIRLLRDVGISAEQAEREARRIF